MRKLLLLALAACGLAASAQTTTLTASHIAADSTRTLLASGSLCLTPVNSSGTPTAYTTGDGFQVLPKQVCYPVTNGAITSVAVPDTADIHPALGFAVAVRDATGAVLYNYTQPIFPTGATWSLDTWAPAQSAYVTSPTVSYGTTAPVGRCGTAPAIFYTNTAQYTCQNQLWTLAAAVANLPANAIPYQGTAGSAPVAATPAEITGSWTGCSGATPILRYDGQCVSASASLPASSIPYQPATGSPVAATPTNVAAMYHSTQWVPGNLTQIAATFLDHTAGTALTGTKPTTVDVPGSAWTVPPGATSWTYSASGASSSTTTDFSLIDTTKFNETVTFSGLTNNNGIQLVVGYATGGDRLAINLLGATGVRLFDCLTGTCNVVSTDTVAAGATGSVVVTISGSSVTVTPFGATPITYTIPGGETLGTEVGMYNFGASGTQYVGGLTVTVPGNVASTVAANGYLNSDGTAGTPVANTALAVDANAHVTSLPEVGYATDSQGNTTIAWQEDNSRGIFDPRRPRVERIDGANTVVTLASNSGLALQATANDAACWAAKNGKMYTINIPPGNWQVGSATLPTLSFGPGYVHGTPGGSPGLGSSGGTVLNAHYTDSRAVAMYSSWTTTCSDGTTVTDNMDGGLLENIQEYGCSTGGCVATPGTLYPGSAGPNQEGVFCGLLHGLCRNLRTAHNGGVGITISGLDSESNTLWSYSDLGYWRFDRAPEPVAAPGTVTATPSTTGGTLAAGTYYYKVTAVFNGETNGSTEVSAATTGTTGSVALSWPAVAQTFPFGQINPTPGITYKVYRGTAAGGESVYFSTSATSLTDTGGAGTAGTVPSTNGSGVYTPANDGMHGDVTMIGGDDRHNHIETYGASNTPGTEFGHVCGVTIGGGAVQVNDIFEQVDEYGICAPYDGGNARISNFRAEGNAGPSLFSAAGQDVWVNGVASQGCTYQAGVTAKGFCDDLEDQSAGGDTWSSIHLYDNGTLGTSYRTGFVQVGFAATLVNVDKANGDNFEPSYSGSNGQIGLYATVPEMDEAIKGGGVALTGASPDVGVWHRIVMQNTTPTNITGVTHATLGQPLHIRLNSANDTLVASGLGGNWVTCTGQSITGPTGVMSFWVSTVDNATDALMREECDPQPYLPLAGGTLTGALTLSADPATALQPATKQYVDAKAVITALTNSTPTNVTTAANVVGQHLVLTLDSNTTLIAHANGGQFYTCTGQNITGPSAQPLNFWALSANNLYEECDPQPQQQVVASSETVTFSATPTFSTTTAASYMVLTGNVTSFTLGAGQDGQLKTLQFCQNATGGYSVTAPANVHGFMTVGSGNTGSTNPSTCAVQDFVYNAGRTAWLATNVGVVSE